MLFMYISVFLSVFFCVNCQHDLPEGSNCTLDGYPGKCVPLDRCQWASRELKIERKRPHMCSYDHAMPIVCCTDCEDMGNISLIVINPLGVKSMFYKTGQKAWDVCLTYLDTLLYECRTHVKTWMEKGWLEDHQCHSVMIKGISATGGRDAERGKYPHMALLGYGEDPTKWLCAGTLVSERFVLTAAHCAITNPKAIRGPLRYIGLGLLKRSDPLKYLQKYKVLNIFKHPEYKDPSKYHDIALVETDTNVRFSFTDNVLPACLQVDDEGVGETAVATGWGLLSEGGPMADNLQEVPLKLFSGAECDTHYPIHRLMKQGINHTSQVCYGDREMARDTCQGDSGGPLQVLGYQGIQCIHTVIGVTSSGWACGLVGQPGIYTRVAPYLSWIESVVWP